MAIIRIDKSIVDEIENVIERRDKMYEDQRARARKLSDSVEKIYTQEVKKLRNQLQQKENIIKEVREILNQDKASASFNTAERIALEILDKVEE